MLPTHTHTHHKHSKLLIFNTILHEEFNLISIIVEEKLSNKGILLLVAHAGISAELSTIRRFV